MDGQEYRRSLKTIVWEDGERQIKRILDAPGSDIDEAKPVKAAAEAFLAELEHGQHLSRETIRKHKNYLYPLIAFCEKRGKIVLKQLKYEDLSTFRTTWSDSPLSAQKKLERLRSFWRFCLRNKWVVDDYAKSLKAPIVRVKPTLPFTQEQFKDILATLDRNAARKKAKLRTNAIRLKAFTLVLRYTGMRIRDAVQLRQDQVGNGLVLLYQHKTGVPVAIPVPDQVTSALAGLPGRTNRHYFFWSGNGNPKSAVGDWQRAYRKLFWQAGITHLPDVLKKASEWPKRFGPDGKPVRAHPHMFRDTFAVEMLLAGTSLEEVSALLGHTSIRTTEASYAPWVKARQDRLEASVRKAWALDPVLNQTDSQPWKN